VTVIEGVVVRGDGLGATLGFPTANIDFQAAPAERGVFVVEVDGADLKARKALCNIGTRPTVTSGPKLVVEVHIPGYSGSLYGEKLTLRLVRKLRDEMKFPSLDALKAQIAADVAAAV
jgi:riboflavin kinase/FMN adenylyltransferase